MLVNKYDFTKLNNVEPCSFVYETLLKQVQFYRNKKYTSINGYKSNYVFFIDDLNVNYACTNAHELSPNKSPSMELMRLLLETRSVYNKDDQLFTPFNDINFLFSST